VTLDGLDEPVRRYLSHAVGPGAASATGVRLTMTGRIKVGAWLPFTASQEGDGRSFAWRASVGLGRFTPLTVVDRFAGGAGSTEGRLFGRRRIFRSEGQDTTRSAAGRAALESVFAPMSLLPDRGVDWCAESDDLVVAAFDVPPERPQLRLRIGADGALVSASALRWRGQEEGYVACGCEVRAERGFGEVVVPSSMRVGWWFGTPQYEPFFEAEITELSLVGGAG
jgi:hypothetical protein